MYDTWNGIIIIIRIVHEVYNKKSYQTHTLKTIRIDSRNTQYISFLFKTHVCHDPIKPKTC